MAAADASKQGSATTDNTPAVKTLGLSLSSITPDLRTKFSLTDDAAGVVVVDVQSNSPGAEKQLKAGDVIVQRGTVHNWINRGSEPCVIAFVLIAAKPVEAGGKVLQAFG